LILDKIIHYSDSRHIAVYNKGRWYKVFMFYKNNLLQPCELQLYVYLFYFINYCFFSSQLDEIIRDTTPPAYGEEHLAALTAGERPLWAEARETYFRGGVNRYSLEAIEKAAFVLILDEEDFEIGLVSLLKRKLIFICDSDFENENFN
jgi:carnitine O-palmitoyltransferase 1